MTVNVVFITGKRAMDCMTANDCTDTCDDNHTMMCVMHHDGGKCHCQHNAR